MLMIAHEQLKIPWEGYYDGCIIGVIDEGALSGERYKYEGR